MDILTSKSLIELRQEEPLRLHRLEHLAIILRGLIGEPTAITPHDLVNRKRTRIRTVLLDDVHEELRTLFSRRPGAERLLDRINVVIDGLRKPDDDQRIIVRRKISRKIGRRGVRVVTADSMKNVNPVLDKLIGRNLKRILTFLDKPALDAILNIRELHTAVTDRRTAMLGEHKRVLTYLGRNRNRITLQKTHISIDIADHFHIRRLLVVLVNQEPNRTGETRSETARGKKRNLLHFFHFVFSFT